MAYTIISQNNTTTTLSDENGNVITVPARVTLATSTDYTIKKVNNNSVDLESGDGKIIRGVPACVVLAGEGGGGGSVDYAKTVQRAETMPTADASNAGQQFLYSGESDATYTHGYIYENVATTTPSSVSAEQTVGSTLSDIAVDLATLESFTGWTTDNSLQIFYTADGWSVDTTSLGVTYTGTPNVGDAITITYTAESTSYAWTRVDVQPGGDYLPLSGGTMTGTITLGSSADIVPTGSSNSIGTAQHPFSTIYASVLSGGSQYGRFMIPVADQSTFGFFIALVDSMPTARQDLEAMIFQYMGVTDSNYTHGYFYECVTDDNTTWYWKQLDVQPSSGGATYTAGNGISIDANNEISVTDPVLTNVATFDTSSNLGVFGGNAFGRGGYGIAIGQMSKAGTQSVAIGTLATCNDAYSTAIGRGTYTDVQRATAIGMGVRATAQNAIIIGAGGNEFATATNSDANTLKVANANGTFEIMNANGNLPADRLASTTGLADGNYRLRCTITNGVPTLSWVAE